MIAVYKFMFVKKDKMGTVKKATQYLLKSDPELYELFETIDIDDLSPEKNYFRSICRSIVYQQLSGKSAGKIFFRFKKIYSEKPFPDPIDLLKTKHATLKEVGLSSPKINYIRNVAQSFIKNKNKYLKLNELSDSQIIEELTKIKGVGPWTVQMFLMFTLNRLDVFPTGDLALRKGFQFYFKLDDLPTEKEMAIRAERWKPYRTYMSLYLWKFLEGPFEW